MTRNLPRTGQEYCYNTSGERIECSGSGQDGELQIGLPQPEPRFQTRDNALVIDNYTGLSWPQYLNAFPFPYLDHFRDVSGLRLVYPHGRSQVHIPWKMPSHRRFSKANPGFCKKFRGHDKNLSKIGK